ncbi:hypothetical protein Tco_0664685 [Tanacetum coccineum]
MIIALIPKVHSPSCVNDYQLISCCNILFKCISKIIASPIKDSLKQLVSPNQSTFVPGRSIADNILLTQELMHNYHLDHGPSRCAFKVDIQKGYDTVDWGFLKEVLIGFGFHNRMIGWIMECTTTSFFISINGSLHGFFKGKPGLRQGDPSSPYLFTLVMEILTLMLQRWVHDSMVFKYHRYCADLELINLCFADDLFLFVHGDVDSAILIRDALEEFKNVSGLTPSLPKSTSYFCNVLNHTKLSILNVLPFEEGRLPVKYLGVPLVTSRLIFRECMELIERQIMRGFLWCHGDIHKGKAKVSWEVVCLPMDEGGLGVHHLDIFNKALMVSHVWKLLSLKESLWVKWIDAYKLKGRSFWDYPLRGNMLWDGERFFNFALLFVISSDSLLVMVLQPRCGLIVGMREVPWQILFLHGIFFDIVVNGVWNWPPYLSAKYPFLNSMAVPNIVVNTLDRLVWHNSLGVVKPFSVAQVWSLLRPRNPKVPWWFFPIGVIGINIFYRVLSRPTSYSISKDPEEEPIEKEPLEEPKEEGLEDSLFTIDLIPFRHGSFDVIEGMNWLSKHRTEIVCHEKCYYKEFDNAAYVNLMLPRNITHWDLLELDRAEVSTTIEAVFTVSIDRYRMTYSFCSHLDMKLSDTTGEAYDKVFNHLDMLHAPLEGKVLILTTAKSLLLLPV